MSLTKITSDGITDGSIVNADINASAAIAGSKIDPDFGSLNITTGGNISAPVLNITGASGNDGIILLNSAGGTNSDFARIRQVIADDSFRIENKASGSYVSRLSIASNGTVTIPNNLDCSAGIDVTGNISCSGTVDGVDIAARDTLFGGLTSSSGVLSNGVTGTTQGASDNTTKVATTAYVTTAVNNLINGAPAALDTLNELAAAMNDDAAFSTTVTNSLATKMPLAGGQFTGNITFSGSQTVDGRDLSVDGAKLDGIESSATADQTASEILTLIKTVDGAGSGLDADTLDGISSASFLRSDATDTVSGAITYTNDVTFDGATAGRDIIFDRSDNALEFADNAKAKFGSSEELQIYYDGTNPTFYAGNKTVRVVADNIHFEAGDFGDEFIRCNHDSSVDLYYDNSLKLSTQSYGVSLTGTLLASENIKTVDNGIIAAGTGDDVKIQHNGTSSFIDNKTGHLYIRGNSAGDVGGNIYIQALSGENGIALIHDAQVALYFNNSQKLETVSGGVTITGTCTATAFSGDGSGLSGIASFPSGTRMIFQQTSAPTGWTKDTSDTNQRALRVVSGSAGSGGSVAFTTAFSSQGVSGSVANATAGGSVGNHTLSTSQIPSHNHGMQQKCIGAGCGPNIPQTGAVGTFGCNNNSTSISTFNTGGGGSHNHSFSGSAHNHSFSGTAINLAVQYLDVIIASKN